MVPGTASHSSGYKHILKGGHVLEIAYLFFMNMKLKNVLSFFLLMLVLSFGGETKAQVYVYPDVPFFFNQMEFNIENGILCEGNRSSWADAIFTIENGKIYKGFSSSPFDLLYTFRDNKLYLQDSNFALDVLYTYEQGKIYQGDSTFPLDLLFTIRNEGVYEGNSISIFDRLFVIDGRPKPDDIFAIMMARGLI